MRQKLPSIDILNRLYWFEELSSTEIARRYNAHHSTVTEKMRKSGIPRRCAGKRLVAMCVEKDCEEPTCRVKRWTKRGMRVKSTTRCAKHYHLWWRGQCRHSRDFNPGILRKPLGQLSIIVHDPS